MCIIYPDAMFSFTTLNIHLISEDSLEKILEYVLSGVVEINLSSKSLKISNF